VRIRSVWPDFLGIVRAPRFGHGKNLNPCVDCKILLLRLAAARMEREGAVFIFTGEVLGQRPMSQRRDALHLIENHSGLKGRLVRPLSAKLLPPTLPELQGILDREKLLDFQGRTRKPQMELAATLGISDYQTPAGGCLLTDPGYTARLGRLLARQPSPDLSDIELLSLGRHFRVGAALLVVGRKESENDRIASLAGGGDLVLKARDVPGPTSLLRGGADDAAIALAARITARYADAKGLAEIPVSLIRGGAPAGEVAAVPCPPQEIEPLRC
jgi:tRNA-uridine 2-sulfurtransferase